MRQLFESYGGLLPPYIGDSAASPSYRSPYSISVETLVAELGTTQLRRELLVGFLSFRSRLRNAGVENAWQWINGSFVENEILRPRDDGKEHPQDIDVVTLWHLPDEQFAGAQTWAEIYQREQEFTDKHPEVFDRDRVKMELRVDSLWIPLIQEIPRIVEQVSYWYGLWSHTKPSNEFQYGEMAWKGFIQVGFNTREDDLAQDALRRLDGHER